MPVKIKRKFQNGFKYISQIFPSRRHAILTTILFIVTFLVLFFVSTDISWAAKSFLQEAPIISSIINAIAWVLMAFAEIAIKVTIFFLDFFIDLASFHEWTEVSIVTLGWVMVRDVANMFFVVVLLVIAFATILGIDSYEMKSLMPKFILMAILINFSKLIAGIILDAVHVFTVTFLNAVSATAGGTLISLFSFSHVHDLATEQGTELGPTQYLLSGSFALIFSLTALVTIGAYVAVLLFRMVALWVLIILSPLAYIAAILPKTQQISQDWWSKFINYALAAPIMVFFLWLAFATLGADAGTLGKVIDTQQYKDAGEITAAKVSSWTSIAKFAIVVAFLLIGIERVESLDVESGGALDSAKSFGKSVAAVGTGVVAGKWAYDKVKGGAGKVWDTTKQGAYRFSGLEYGEDQAKKYGNLAGAKLKEGRDSDNIFHKGAAWLAGAHRDEKKGELQAAEDEYQAATQRGETRGGRSMYEEERVGEAQKRLEAEQDITESVKDTRESEIEITDEEFEELQQEGIKAEKEAEIAETAAEKTKDDRESELLKNRNIEEIMNRRQAANNFKEFSEELEDLEVLDELESEGVLDYLEKEKELEKSKERLGKLDQIESAEDLQDSDLADEFIEEGETAEEGLAKLEDERNLLNDLVSDLEGEMEELEVSQIIEQTDGIEDKNDVRKKMAKRQKVHREFEEFMEKNEEKLNLDEILSDDFEVSEDDNIADIIDTFDDEIEEQQYQAVELKDQGQKKLAELQQDLTLEEEDAREAEIKLAKRKGQASRVIGEGTSEMQKKQTKQMQELIEEFENMDWEQQQEYIAKMLDGFKDAKGDLERLRGLDNKDNDWKDEYDSREEFEEKLEKAKKEMKLFKKKMVSGWISHAERGSGKRAIKSLWKGLNHSKYDLEDLNMDSDFTIDNQHPGETMRDMLAIFNGGAEKEDSTYKEEFDNFIHDGVLDEEVAQAYLRKLDPTISHHGGNNAVHFMKEVMDTGKDGVPRAFSEGTLHAQVRKSARKNNSLADIDRGRFGSHFTYDKGSSTILDINGEIGTDTLADMTNGVSDHNQPENRVIADLEDLIENDTIGALGAFSKIKDEDAYKHLMRRIGEDSRQKLQNALAEVEGLDDDDIDLVNEYNEDNQAKELRDGVDQENIAKSWRDEHKRAYKDDAYRAFNNVLLNKLQGIDRDDVDGSNMKMEGDTLHIRDEEGNTKTTVDLSEIDEKFRDEIEVHLKNVDKEEKNYNYKSVKGMIARAATGESDDYVYEEDK